MKQERPHGSTGRGGLALCQKYTPLFSPAPPPPRGGPGEQGGGGGRGGAPPRGSTVRAFLTMYQNYSPMFCRSLRPWRRRRISTVSPSTA